MKDKTNLKIIVAVIVSVIISSGITAFAAIKFQANEIGYNTTSVADALDSLYQTQFSNNYSTEEKVIGKWIDGKPLYQKSFAISNLTASTPWKKFQTFQNVSIKNFSGAASSNSYGIVPIPFRGNSDFILFSYKDDIIQYTTSSTLGNLTNGYLTIQYTKTTDQPISD